MLKEEIIRQMMLQMQEKDLKISDLEQVLEDQCLELSQVQQENNLLLGGLVRLGTT